jgi:hypothetical protein
VTDLQFDVHGLRTFRVSDDGNLLPVTAVDDSWRGGVCIARCRHRPSHRAPVESCRCGIYTFRTLSVLRGQYAPADLLVAVVALEGQTLAGSRGWRSQAGRVVALWVASEALSDNLLMKLSDNLPDVKIYQDVDEMLALYPDLSIASATETTGSSRGTPRLRQQARLPLRRNAIRVERVPVYLVLTALAGGFFVHAEQLSPPTGTMYAVAGLGRFLAAHNQLLVIPLLLIGLSIYARASSSMMATWLSRLVRVAIPVIGAGVVAALITGSHVETSPLILTIALLLWSHSRVLLAEICHSDGAGSVLARKIVRARTTRTTTLASQPRSPGVEYQLRPDHSPRTYPLTIPVHFEPGTP